MLLSMGPQGMSQSTSVLTMSDESRVVLLIDRADVAIRNVDRDSQVVDGIGSLWDQILMAPFWPRADYVFTLLPEQVL